MKEILILVVFNLLFVSSSPQPSSCPNGQPPICPGNLKWIDFPNCSCMCDPGLKPCVRNEIRNPITCECAFIKVCEANPFCAKMSPFPECTCVECNKEPCDGGELRAPPECECMPSSQSSTTPSPIIYCDPAPGCGNFLPWPECRCTECTKDLCPNGQPRDLNAFCQCTSEPSIACDPSPDCGKWLGWPDCACETCISDFCEDGQPRYPPPFCNCPLPTESPSETLPSYVCDPIWPPLNNGNQWLPYPDCKWVCSEIILNCQDGQNQDLESCECEPQIVCDPPFGCEKWVGWPDCRCEGCSSDPCENGQPRELPSCECKNYVCDPIWPPSPPGNQWLPYPDCRWFCDLNQLMCTPGFKPDKKTCTCVCEPQDCPCNQVWNKKSCRCECEKVKKCPKNKFWNEGTCQCECRESCRDCTPPQVWNDNDCSCQCPKKRDCKPLMFWNERTCDCECLSKKRHCCENKIWNQKTCDCECLYSCKCAPNFIWDPYTCNCVCAKKLNCKPVNEIQRYFDEGSCSCLCENAKLVRCMFGFDHEKCKCRPKLCVQNVMCAKGFIWDKYQCRCVPEVVEVAEFCMQMI